MALGYFSLIRIHRTIEQNFGEVTGWIVVTGALMLCGFGIYLGRFLRWNSWNAFTHPLQLLKATVERFIDAGEYPHPLAVIALVGIGLIIGYLTLRVALAESAETKANNA